MSPDSRPEAASEPASASAPDMPANVTTGQKSDGARIPFPSKVLDSPPLMEEYHSLSMTWNGSGETTRPIHADHDADSAVLGTIAIDKDTLGDHTDDFIEVITPRAIVTRGAITVRFTIGDRERDVALAPGDALYLYAYQGEGMCDVGFRDEDGVPVLGESVCPGMGDGDWTTSSGNDRLAERLDWWFELENKEGVRGWVRFDLTDLDLELVMNDERE